MIIDIIPDYIPGLGYVDDAAVIAGCLLLVKTDLEDYRLWRKGKGYEFDDLPNYEEIEKEAKKGQWLSNKLMSSVSEYFFLHLYVMGEVKTERSE